MSLKREPLQIVEIDIDYCNLTYGSAPCSAALDETGVRKCYNTYATCQVQPKFGAPDEPKDSADHTYASGDTVFSSSFALDEPILVAADVTFPATASNGVIWEMGGSVIGSWLGIHDGDIVLRVYDDVTRQSEQTTSATPYLGRTGTIYWSSTIANPATITAWWWDPGTRVLTQLFQDTSTEIRFWSGSDNGGVGKVTSDTIGPNSTAWPGTITQVRAYENAATTVTQPNTTKTLRFARNQGGLPLSPKVYPALMDVSTSPTAINVGGVDDRTGTLGKRARVQVKLQDFQDSDRGLDRYVDGRIDGTAQTDEGGYQPAERGTFFGRLRHRFPYYAGRALRRKEGYVGDDIASMPTRHFVMSEWRGPSASGAVDIVAKDVLDLADNKKAVAPKPTRGKLAKDIDENFTGEIELTPPGVGVEYDDFGLASIGSEVLFFTRSGDVLTITARGRRGSSRAAHSAGDAVQQCYTVSNGTVWGVAEELLKDFAGVDAAFIPSSDWADEGSRWLPNLPLNAVVPKPTGVAKLISELAEFGVFFWWDESAQEIKFRVNRPVDLGETVGAVNDDAHILADSANLEDMHDQRLTQVLFYHGMIDPTGSIDDPRNYRKAAAVVDLEAQGPNEYDQERFRQIFTRWLGQNGNDVMAEAIAKRLVNRYRDTPQRLTFDADIKDRDDLTPASLHDVTTRFFQDETGASKSTQCLVLSAEETQPSHRLRVTVQTFNFRGRYRFWAPDSLIGTTYDTATEEERAKYGFWADDDATLGSDDDPAHQWF